MNGTAFAVVNGSRIQISKQVAYATAYHNVLATGNGNNPHIHPSEPNYIWAEAGTNFGVLNDNDPYSGEGPTNQDTPLHLSNLLTTGWKNVEVVSGRHRPYSEWQRTHQRPPAAGTVDRSADQFLRDFASGYFNAYNGSSQYNYAAKHNPMVFFTDTNGGNDATPTNPLSAHYAPLQQLLTDLAQRHRGRLQLDYARTSTTICTRALSGGYKGLTGDAAKIKQGDDFLSQIVPVIMASNAYKNHGVIIIWWDESESDGVAGDNADDFNHTIGEIVISPRAHRERERPSVCQPG